MSGMERDLEELEARDPAVKQAAERLDDTTAAIVTGEDQAIADALLVTCGLRGCEQPPGKVCVNSVDGTGPRGEPHWNRVFKGRRIVRGHRRLPVRMQAPDFQAPAGDDGESTSARLRRVEQERDHANDLTDKIAAELRLVTRERDSLARRLAARFADAVQLRTELAATEWQRDGWAKTNDLLRAELASARTELAQLRYSGWIVARDGGRDCERCKQEIRRGEAYEDIPDTDGAYLHAYCPTEGEPDV